MGWPVVTVASGGIPVTDNSALGYGIPVDEAANGMGTAVTYVSSGGLPVVGIPTSPSAYLKGADGAYLKGADGAYLYGVGP